MSKTVFYYLKIDGKFVNLVSTQFRAKKTML